MRPVAFNEMTAPLFIPIKNYLGDKQDQERRSSKSIKLVTVWIIGMIGVLIIMAYALAGLLLFGSFPFCPG
jgi:hypothetical protein